MNLLQLWRGHIAQLERERDFHKKRLRFQEKELSKEPGDPLLAQFVKSLKGEVNFRQKMIDRALKTIEKQTRG